MAGQPAIFHALLRPAMLQLLRATGYHSTRGAVLDSLTELAARYLSALCEATAAHAAHNRGDAADYAAADVRLALRDVGALLPERVPPEQAWRGAEDLRGLDDFLAWFDGPRMRELLDLGRGDGEADATDYLGALKKKHSKTAEDARYHGTVIGRAADAAAGADVQVEGGATATIDDWIGQRAAAAPAANGRPASPSAASSGLSSVGDRLLDDDDAGQRAHDGRMDLG